MKKTFFLISIFVALPLLNANPVQKKNNKHSEGFSDNTNSASTSTVKPATKDKEFSNKPKGFFENIFNVDYSSFFKYFLQIFHNEIYFNFIIFRGRKPIESNFISHTNYRIK